MNLNELKIEFAKLKDFEFVAKTAKEAEDATTVPAENFAVPGLYRVLFGSRGFIEEIVREGDGAEELNVPSIEEAIDTLTDESGENRDQMAEYVGEYYFASEDAETGGVLNFGYTEEDVDFYILVK